MKSRRETIAAAAFATLLASAAQADAEPRGAEERRASEVATAAPDGASETYRVSHFSDEFYATVTVRTTEPVSRPGSVSVFETRAGRRLLHVESEELSFQLEDGEVSANVKELPYGRQDVLIYEDFDFDGRKDLAIMDGQNSCYHGPSFRIFLRTRHGFAESRPFTRLAQEYCGMFQVDAKARHLATMTKSGCCWHQYNTYSVVNHVPRLIESIEESVLSSSAAYLKVQTTGRLPATRWFRTAEPDSGIIPILAFDLAGPGQRRVEVFASEGTLDYALLVGSEHRVAFSYLLDVLGERSERAPERAPEHRPSPFRWEPTRRELSFHNGGYQYVIHDSPEQLGVAVHARGQVVFLQGNRLTRRGDLGDLRAKAKELTNLEILASSSAEKAP